jgi:tryptophan-rich sensory protein
MKSPFWGLIDISILFILIILTIFAFFRVSRLGGVLLIPYLLWVGFASILNYAILILN